MDTVVTSSINAAIAQANQTYRHSLRSGISDALQEQIRAGFMEMMQLINEVLKPQVYSSEQEKAVDMPPIVVVENMESDHQCDANVSSTDPPALNEPGCGRHDRHVDDHIVEKLREKQLAEWIAGVGDRSFCFEPG
ncbi:hypothetical protein ACLKA7_005083 [Drosophila subpalustris]